MQQTDNGDENAESAQRQVSVDDRLVFPPIEQVDAQHVVQPEGARDNGSRVEQHSHHDHHDHHGERAMNHHYDHLRRRLNVVIVLMLVFDLVACIVFYRNELGLPGSIDTSAAANAANAAGAAGAADVPTASASPSDSIAGEKTGDDATQKVATASGVEAGSNTDFDNRTTVPNPHRDPIVETLENLHTADMQAADGSAQLVTAGFTLSDADRRAVDEALATFSNAGYSVGMVLADLDTGAVLTSSGSVPKYSASSIKGPYVMSLAATGAMDLDAVAGRRDGVASAVHSDIEQAIQVSDNDAYGALYLRYGTTPMTSWLDGSGVQHNLTDHEYLDLSAIDLAIMWTKAYQYLFTDTVDAASSQPVKASADARAWLASNYRDSLSSTIHMALGDSAPMLSKAGWIAEAGYLAFNDGGIVLPGSQRSEYGGVAITERPSAYVLTMLTDAYGEYDLLANLASTLGDVYHNSMQRQQ